MTVYNPSMPQAYDIPAENQPDFVSNFSLLNQFFGVDHVPYSGVITNITNANPGVITSPYHALITGDTITFSNLRDTAINPNSNPANLPDPDYVITGMGALNGNTYTVTRIDQNSFSFGVNTSNTTTYVPYVLGNGGNFSRSPDRGGDHIKTTFPSGTSGPNRAAPISTSFVDTNLNLFFQNGAGSSFSQLLSSFNLVDAGSHFGMKTPWGLIINFGVITPTLSSTGATTFTYPIAYNTKVYSLIVTPTAQPSGKVNAFGVIDPVSLSTFQAGTMLHSIVDLWYATPVNYIAIGK